MSMRVNAVCVSLILLASKPSSGQDTYVLNGFVDHRIRPSRIATNTPALRNEITFRRGNTTGQWKVFRNWNEGQAVVAENDSVVWMGTPVGLVRWNTASRTYQTFDEGNGLRFTSINSLALDKTGRLWIAATQGVAVYAAGIFTHYDYTNCSLPASTMQVVCVDSSNRIVIAFGPPLSGGWYQDGGIARFDGSAWQIWRYGSSVYWGPTFAMCTYHDTVWITGGRDLFILSGETFDRAPGWTFGGGYSAAVDYQDSLWIASTTQKILKLTPNGWQTIVDGEIGGDIWNDPRGGLWISNRDIWWLGYGPWRLDINLRRQGILCGTQYAGICTVPGIPGQFRAQHAFSPTAQFFASLGSGTDWIHQINQGGLYKFNGSQWEVFRVPSPLLENYIYGLGGGSNGDVYLSTPFYSQKTNGVTWETIGGRWTSIWTWNRDFRFAPNGTMFTNHNQAYVGGLTGLDFDGFGNLWGTYPLLRFSWPSFSQTVFADSTMGIRPPWRPQFMDVIVDKHERVWAAAWYYGGVMFDQVNWHPIPPSDTTLPNGDYDLVFADSHDRVWFGTNQSSPNYGFTVFDGKEWRTYYSSQRYSISYVYQIAEDHLGNVWLATGGGLIRYDGSSFTVFDSENSPLTLNSTSAVAVDSRGAIWVGTRRGLYVYNPLGPVELGPYSFSSPVDSLSVAPVGRFAKARFRPTMPSLAPLTYQLQRGRGTHKFWEVADSVCSSSPPEIVEIVDSSNIIGRYFYRVREVTSDGKVRYSPAVQFVGGTPNVTLTAFRSYTSGKLLYLSWETADESFVQRFELWRRDTLGGQFSLNKVVLPDSSPSQVKQYTTELDSLRRASKTMRYSLRVVYRDSTRSELRTIDIAPSLPTTFRVSQNYPNPFNSSTTFDVEMPVSGFVVLRLYDILGREVRTVGEQVEEGFHKLQADMSFLATGVYLYSLESLGQRVTGKLLLLK